ncbi:MAG: hypothetical protein [Namikivirus usui]|uniref:Uncharacterized protein n=1 Tax=Bacteriophage sp. TaxID=38018 RepID=A0ABY5TRL5_9VIRU|nr:MAG: hypothetical protein [Bacteriophage sp.]
MVTERNPMNPKKHPISYKLGTIAAYTLITAGTVLGITGTIALMKLLIIFILS